MTVERFAPAYADQGHDRVREELERPAFARLVPGLLAEAGGGAMLDLGCGDGLAGRLAGDALTRYTGVDLNPSGPLPGHSVRHDLRDGLGPVGRSPFDLYLGTFGVASHLGPGELARLLRDVARHARPGALVALEALGLRSLEWPRMWDTAPGQARVLPYRLGRDVQVHPWSAAELAGLYSDAGIRPLRAVDRTVQAGPKTGDGRYWPGLPPLRRALNRLLEDCGSAEVRETLASPLPPLPAGPTAHEHQSLAARRRRLVQDSSAAAPRVLARAVWALDPESGQGLGHGLTVIGRVA